MPFREPLVTWEKRITKMCNGKFCGYNNLFCLLKDVQVDPTMIVDHKKSTGKENITDNGFLKFRNGLFRQNCENKPKYAFRPNDRLTDWLNALNTSNNYPIKTENHESNFAVAITRYEYANLYHTITDWFNIFLVTTFHKQNPRTCTIIFLDGHAKTKMDVVWKTLFRKVIYIKEMKEAMLFDELIWGITGYLSPLNQHKLNHLYYLEEFRKFYLFSYNVKDIKILNCKKLSVLLILRKDYVAHPNNPTGHVSRKIYNEKELEATIEETLLSTYHPSSSTG
ncbi:hypothetical protein KUTeg_018238 [Tegillarca granosa]|uniref:Uncharacterized protein n=1 Tax=Tegillarca granosa TaxID=220873 RepID=A0ABQ9EHG7_TEGGR|nr:hypothetical protein KUTeg_018238 [Tegillarca granosa]